MKDQNTTVTQKKNSQGFLSLYDVFGYKIGLNLGHNKRKYGTRIGSIATLIYIILSLAFVAKKVLDLTQVVILNEKSVVMEETDHTLDEIGIFPYFQIYDRDWKPLNFDQNLQRYLHFEILINEYKDYAHLINDFQEVKACSQEDFKNTDSIFNMKSKDRPDTLVCLNDLKKVVLRNGVSNRKSQKNFQIVVTACNPNTRDDCERNPQILKQTLAYLNIQLFFMEHALDEYNEIIKVDKFVTNFAPTTGFDLRGQLTIQKNQVNDQSFYSIQELRSWQFRQDNINEEGVQEYAKFEISFSDQQKIHETKNFRVVRTCSDIGGFLTFFFILFYVIFKPLAKRFFVIDAIESLYQIITKNIDLQEQLPEETDEKELDILRLSSAQNTSLKYTMRSEDQKEHVRKGQNITLKTSQKMGLFCFDIFCCSFCKKTSLQKYYVKSKQKMDQELDIATIIKNLRTMNDHASGVVYTDSEEELQNMIEAELTRRGGQIENMEPRIRETVDMMQLQQLTNNISHSIGAFNQNSQNMRK